MCVKEECLMAKLAIKGGRPVISDGLKIKWPIFDEADEKALIKVLKNGQSIVID